MTSKLRSQELKPQFDEPSTPPVAPVAWMRDWASDCVVQVMEVPALLTRGREKHCSDAAH
jgi:hypothetical protein